MTEKAIILTKDDYSAPLDVEGVFVTELASAEDTGGQEFTFQFGEQGEGAPLHSHEWDETFFILKGSAKFICGGVERNCGPGSFIFVPGGTEHSFEFGPDGCEMFDVAGAGSKALPFFKKIAAQHAKANSSS